MFKFMKNLFYIFGCEPELSSSLNWCIQFTYKSINKTCICLKRNEKIIIIETSI